MARVNLHTQLTRARFFLDLEVDNCRHPTKEMTPDSVQSRLRDCMDLLNHIERVEDYMRDLSVHRFTSIQDLVDNMAKRPKTIDRTYQSMMVDRLAEYVAAMNSFVTRLKNRTGEGFYMAEIKSHEIITRAEIVDACFDAAIACEAHFESTLR